MIVCERLKWLWFLLCVSPAAFQSIFLLCTNKKEGKPGILLLNKLAFSERPEDLRELLAGARLHHLSDNDIYGNFELFPAERFAALKTTFIYPATQKHIDKYRLRPVHHIQENAQDYQKITLPFIQSSQFSLEVGSGKLQPTVRGCSVGLQHPGREEGAGPGAVQEPGSGEGVHAAARPEVGRQDHGGDVLPGHCAAP